MNRKQNEATPPGDTRIMRLLYDAPAGAARRRPCWCICVTGFLDSPLCVTPRHAISSAISIMWVKVVWRSSAGRLSPVARLSEMVSSASAFFPAAAAFRYSA